MSDDRTARSFGIVVAAAALLAFLMCAAAASIVASASSPDARELEVAANSVVAASESERVVSVGAGVHVPQLIEIQNSELAATPAASGTASSDRNIVQIGVLSGTSASFSQTVRDLAVEWAPAESNEQTRIDKAAKAIGAKLRTRDISALVLPPGFAGADPSSCTIAVGLHKGGAIPVLRLPGTSAADAAATNDCLTKLARRNPTVYVDARNPISPAVAASMNNASAIVEVTSDRVWDGLDDGAMVLIVSDAKRGATVDLLTGSDSDEATETVTAAARRFGAWIASAPTLGAVPTAAVAKRRRQKEKELKLRGLQKLENSKNHAGGSPGTGSKPSDRGSSKGSDQTGGASPNG